MGVVHPISRTGSSGEQDSELTAAMGADFSEGLVAIFIEGVHQCVLTLFQGRLSPTLRLAAA
jgi:hypothetical protein